MAYIPQQIPEDEKNLFARKEPTTPNPIPPQTGGSSGSGGQGTGAAPGVGTSTQFGSNAAKLSDYLKANQEQAAGFGQQVAGNLTNQYNQTIGGINQAGANFSNDVNQGWAKPDQAKMAQAASNPTEFASNPENVSQFRSWYNDQYTGPQNFETSGYYGDVNKSVNDAVQNSSLVGNTAGLGTYLNNFMGAQDTTPGMRALDTALLSGNKESAQAIREAAAPYQNLSGYLSNQAQSANQNVENAKQQANQTRTTLQNQFAGEKGIIPTFQNELANKYNTAITEGQSAYDKLLSDLKSGNLGALSGAGLDSNQLIQFMNDISSLPAGTVDPTAYLTNQVAQIRPENFASKADYDKAIALGKLTGADMGYLNEANAGQAGTAPNPYNFNYQQANQDLTNAINTYASGQAPGQPMSPTTGGNGPTMFNPTGTNNDLLNAVINPLSTLQPIQNAATGVVNYSPTGSTNDIVNAVTNPTSTLKPITNVANDIIGSVGGNLFGGGSGQSTWQSGNVDFNSMSNRDVALKLGTNIGQLGYDAATPGSFERAYDMQLSRLSPADLIERYSSLNDPNNFQTPLDQQYKALYDQLAQVSSGTVSAEQFSQMIQRAPNPYDTTPTQGFTTGRGYIDPNTGQYRVIS